MEEKQQLIARRLYDKYIFGTDPLEIIKEELVVVGRLSKEVMIAAKINIDTVHLSSRALKHIHEGRSDEHFEIILDNLHYFIMDPEGLYLNKPTKRATKKGTHLLIRELEDNKHFFCVVENVDQKNNHFEIVTIAPCKPEKYLKDCKQLWKREDA